MASIFTEDSFCDPAPAEPPLLVDASTGSGLSWDAEGWEIGSLKAESSTDSAAIQGVETQSSGALDAAAQPDLEAQAREMVESVPRHSRTIADLYRQHVEAVDAAKGLAAKREAKKDVPCLPAPLDELQRVLAAATTEEAMPSVDVLATVHRVCQALVKHNPTVPPSWLMGAALQDRLAPRAVKERLLMEVAFPVVIRSVAVWTTVKALSKVRHIIEGLEFRADDNSEVYGNSSNPKSKLLKLNLMPGEWLTKVETEVEERKLTRLRLHLSSGRLWEVAVVPGHKDPKHAPKLSKVGQQVEMKARMFGEGAGAEKFFWRKNAFGGKRCTFAAGRNEQLVGLQSEPIMDGFPVISAPRVAPVRALALDPTTEILCDLAVWQGVSESNPVTCLGAWGSVLGGAAPMGTSQPQGSPHEWWLSLETMVEEVTPHRTAAIEVLDENRFVREALMTASSHAKDFGNSIRWATTNVVNRFGLTSQVALMDLDSLLLSIFDTTDGGSSGSSDNDDSTGRGLVDMSFGLQSLHCMHLLERKLKEFLKRGIVLQIVCFDTHAALWLRHNGSFALLRQAAIAHLTNVYECGGLPRPVRRFHGWHRVSGPEGGVCAPVDPAWAEFVSSHRPRLLFLDRRLPTGRLLHGHAVSVGISVAALNDIIMTHQSSPDTLNASVHSVPTFEGDLAGASPGNDFLVAMLAAARASGLADGIGLAGKGETVDDKSRRPTPATFAAEVVIELLGEQSMSHSDGEAWRWLHCVGHLHMVALLAQELIPLDFRALPTDEHQQGSELQLAISFYADRFGMRAARRSISIFPPNAADLFDARLIANLALYVRERISQMQAAGGDGLGSEKQDKGLGAEDPVHVSNASPVLWDEDLGKRAALIWNQCSECEGGGALLTFEESSRALADWCSSLTSPMGKEPQRGASVETADHSDGRVSAPPGERGALRPVCCEIVNAYLGEQHDDEAGLNEEQVGSGDCYFDIHHWHSNRLLESTGDTGGLLSEPEQIKVNDYRRGMRALSESLSSRTKRVHPDLHALLERYLLYSREPAHEAFKEFCSQLILDLGAFNGTDHWDRRASELEAFWTQHGDQLPPKHPLRFQLAKLAALMHNESDRTSHAPPARLRVFATALSSAASWTEAQLELLGDQMIWEYETVDPKLLDGHSPAIEFTPEAWQWEMIQAADRDASLLVTAPTSSGKTFIASYIIRKVLRKDPSGVVVFVLPTKALVNQCYAELMLDTEEIPTAEVGVVKTVRDSIGVFTADTKVNNEKANVLICVPQILNILLTSPQRALDGWHERLRYAIVDEVHKLEDEEAYEHLLHLLPCPYVALSATLGNAHEFHSWLAANTSREPPMLIQHHERATALKFYHYCGGHGVGSLQSIDPMLRLLDSSTRASAREFEQRLAALPPLTSQQLLRLWTALDCQIENQLELRSWASFGEKEMEKALSALIELVDTSLALDNKSCWLAVPDAIFTLKMAIMGGSRLKAGASARDGDGALSSIEERLFADHALQLVIEAEREAEGGLDQDYATVLSRLRDRLQAFILPTEGAAWSPAHAFKALVSRSAPRNFFPDEGDSSSVLTRNSVRAFDKAIRLLISLINCENGPLRSHVLKGLTTALRPEGELVQDAVWDAGYIRRQLLPLVQRLMSEGLLPSICFHLHRRGIDRFVQTLLESAFDPFEAEARLDELFPERAQQRREEVSEWCSKLRKRFSAGDDNGLGWMIDALERGIAVHYGSAPGLYLQAVEILMRAGHLRLIFATTTLALGIHMPCRTVVFLGKQDSLTDTDFLQCAGRAGRRGFDNVGHVIFVAFLPSELDHALLADIPSVRGHQPLTTSLVLRCLNQTYCLDDAAAVFNGPAAQQLAFANRQAWLRLLQHPLFCSGRRIVYSEEHMRHFFGFSVQFLARYGYVSRIGGAPQTAAALAMRTMYADPVNFLFVAVLQSGVLDSGLWPEGEGDYLSASNDVRDTYCRKLLVILIHIFYPIHTTDNDHTLPALPAAVLRVVETFESEVTQLFTRYLHGAAAGLPNKERLQLPLGGEARFPAGRKPSEEAVEVAPSLVAWLEDRCAPARVRSPFAAISGGNDVFDGLYDLLYSVRDDIYWDVSMLPLRSLVPQVHSFLQVVYDRRELLNAFDEAATCYRRDDAEDAALYMWRLLRKLDASLELLVTSSQKAERTPVTYAIATLAKEFKTLIAHSKYAHLVVVACEATA